MTSGETPKDPIEILTKSSEELSEKTVTIAASIAKTLGRRAEALGVLTGERGLQADPERIGRISENLFNAVDTLIFLAEDIRGLQQRIAESNGPEAGNLQPLSDQTTSEAELLSILKERGGEPIAMVAILEAGFGLEYSQDLTTRKKHLQRTIASLTTSLDASNTEQKLVKTGRTRGTKYHLAHSQSLLPIEPTTPSFPEQEILPPSVTPAPERAPRNPLEPLVADAIHSLITEDVDRPIICLADITREAFGARILDQEVFQQVKALIAQDSRLKQISHFEFHITERSLEGNWINQQEIRESVETFIEKMTQWDASEETIVHLFKAVGRGRRFLTSPERSVLIEKLKQHHQFVAIRDGSFTINATAAPAEHDQQLKGMSPSEIERQLNVLGIKGKGQPFRRRR